MRQGSKSERAGAVGKSLDAAMAGLRRQLRIRNILLVIVGIEATVFMRLEIGRGNVQRHPRTCAGYRRHLRQEQLLILVGRVRQLRGQR
jgi:hypothetical protein